MNVDGKTHANQFPLSWPDKNVFLPLSGLPPKARTHASDNPGNETPGVPGGAAEAAWHNVSLRVVRDVYGEEGVTIRCPYS